MLYEYVGFRLSIKLKLVLSHLVIYTQRIAAADNPLIQVDIKMHRLFERLELCIPVTN